MSFQGSKFRERLLPISFLESFYFPRVLPLMGDRLFPSNLVHSFRGFQFSLWSFAILMCTLINHGKIYLQFYLADIRLDLLKYYKKSVCSEFWHLHFPGEIYLFWSSCFACLPNFTIFLRFVSSSPLLIYYL